MALHQLAAANGRPGVAAIVLLGPQAIYVHTDDADLAVAEYATDADFTISRRELADPLMGLMTPGAS